jgi:hypothetical protein
VTVQWVLVIVTGLTGVFIGLQAWETRKAAKAAAASVEAIKRQANIMERQTKAAEDNASAAREGAEATKRNIDIVMAKERATIRVQPNDLVRESGPLAVHGASYTVFCYGTTRADIEDAWATVEVTDSEEASGSGMHVPMSLGPVLVPTPPEGIKKNALIFHKPEGELIGPVNDRKLFVHFFGSVVYRDVFGQAHETKFRYLWRVTDLRRWDESVLAFWLKSPKPEENYEI